LTLLLIKVCPATIKLTILFTNNQSLGWAPPKRENKALSTKEPGGGAWAEKAKKGGGHWMNDKRGWIEGKLEMSGVHKGICQIERERPDTTDGMYSRYPISWIFGLVICGKRTIS